MFKEFYVGETLAQYPMIYALSHQIIEYPIYGFVVVLVRPDLAFAPAMFAYIGMNIGASMTFEIGRKLDEGGADPEDVPSRSTGRRRPPRSSRSSWASPRSGRTSSVSSTSRCRPGSSSSRACRSCSRRPASTGRSRARRRYRLHHVFGVAIRARGWGGRDDAWILQATDDPARFAAAGGGRRSTSRA